MRARHTALGQPQRQRTGDGGHGKRQPEHRHIAPRTAHCVDDETRQQRDGEVDDVGTDVHNGKAAVPVGKVCGIRQQMAVAQPVAAVRKARQKPKPQVPARGVVPQHDQQQIQHIVAQNTQHRRHAGIRALQKPCRQQHGRRAAQEKRSVIHHHDLYVARLPQQHRIDKYMGQAVKYQKTRMHRQKTVKSAAQRLAVDQHP